jgi:hypothetical protein
MRHNVRLLSAESQTRSSTTDRSWYQFIDPEGLVDLGRVEPPGIEPITSGLQIRRSTTTLMRPLTNVQVSRFSHN